MRHSTLCVSVGGLLGMCGAHVPLGKRNDLEDYKEAIDSTHRPADKAHSEVQLGQSADVAKGGAKGRAGIVGKQWRTGYTIFCSGWS